MEREGVNALQSETTVKDETSYTRFLDGKILDLEVKVTYGDESENKRF